MKLGNLKQRLKREIIISLGDGLFSTAESCQMITRRSIIDTISFNKYSSSLMLTLPYSIFITTPSVHVFAFLLHSFAVVNALL